MEINETREFTDREARESSGAKVSVMVSCLALSAFVLYAIMALAGKPTAAQSMKDFQPVPTVKVQLFDAQNKKHTFELPVPHRTADKAFWLWTIGSGLATVADVENTQFCMRDTHCQETNPIFGGPHPSRLRMYSIAGALAGFATYISYRQKREEDAAIAFGATPSKPRWWFGPAMVGGSHIFGTIFTLAATGR